MSHTCVIGIGWGDEGKGKVVDLLCRDFDFVVRFNGGANAGHTVCIGEETFALHLVPSGILHPHMECVIGPGVVIDPETLLHELDTLQARGIDGRSRLHISDRAHVVMPYHQLEDRLGESKADECDRIGTTNRGIGPCYADKIGRHQAIRMADLRPGNLQSERIARVIRAKRERLTRLFGGEAEFDIAEVVEQSRVFAERLADRVCDTTALLEHAMADGKRFLFEGANGALLDVDHGTYPFVTSSTTLPGGIAAGAGVPPRTVSRVVGVCKAYATRVGEGPFVSELKDATGEWIRERGHEYGTTTGRPRRCGWFDTVCAKYAVRLAGATEVAMMHLDTLTGLKEIGVCVGYEVNGKRVDRMVADAAELETARPVIETMPGWDEDISNARQMSDLPVAARNYIERITQGIGAPVRIIGVGPRRAQTIMKDD